MGESEQDNVLCTPYNTINLSHPDAASEWVFSSTDKMVNLIIIPLISSFGLLGNLAFLFSIYRIRSMQTSLNVFTQSLAVADAVYLVSVIYWALIDYNKSKIPNDAFGSWVECGIFAIVVHLSYFASIGFITFISIERYFAICAPLKHRSMKGKTRTYRLTAAVWICAFTIAALYVPQFAFTKMCLIWPETEEYNSLPTIFKACLPLNTYVAVYAMLIAIISFVFALLINGTIYIKIIIALTRRSTDDLSKQQDTSVQLRNQVTRTLVINGIIFFLCQTPYRVANTDNLLDNISEYDLLSKKVYDTIHNIGISFFMLNSCINPYLYVLGSRQYRDAMRDAFKTTFCRCLVDKNDKVQIACVAQSSTPPIPSHSTTVTVVTGDLKGKRL